MSYNKELYGKKEKWDYTTKKKAGQSCREIGVKRIKKPVKNNQKDSMCLALTPVTAVPVQAQARGSKYQGALEIIISPKA